MLALIKTFPFVRAFIRSLFYFLIWCRLLGICCFLSWDSCICRKLKRMSVCDFYSFVKFYWKELVLKAVRPRSEKLSHRHLNMAINLIFIGNQTRKITNNFFFFYNSDPLWNPVTKIYINSWRGIFRVVCTHWKHIDANF